MSTVVCKWDTWSTCQKSGLPAQTGRCKACGPSRLRTRDRRSRSVPARALLSVWRARGARSTASKRGLHRRLERRRPVQLVRARRSRGGVCGSAYGAASAQQQLQPAASATRRSPTSRLLEPALHGTASRREPVQLCSTRGVPPSVSCRSLSLSASILTCTRLTRHYYQCSLPSTCTGT